MTSCSSIRLAAKHASYIYIYTTRVFCAARTQQPLLSRFYSNSARNLISPPKVARECVYMCISLVVIWGLTTQRWQSQMICAGYMGRWEQTHTHTHTGHPLIYGDNLDKLRDHNSLVFLGASAFQDLDTTLGLYVYIYIQQASLVRQRAGKRRRAGLNQKNKIQVHLVCPGYLCCLLLWLVFKKWCLNRVREQLKRVCARARRGQRTLGRTGEHHFVYIACERGVASQRCE